MARAHLTIVFHAAEQLLAQEAHLARGCVFVPGPSPTPEPFAELSLHLIAPFLGGARASMEGRIVQIAPGHGIAVALADVQLARAQLAPLFAQARSSGGTPGTSRASATWGEPGSALAGTADRGEVAGGKDVVGANAVAGVKDAAGTGESADVSELSGAGEAAGEGAGGGESGGADLANAGDDSAPAESGPLYDQIKVMSAQEKMRLAVHGDRTARLLLMKDINKTIQLFVLQNKRITLDEVRYLASYRQAHPEVLAQIAGNRDWSGNPNVLAALVRNPKTPSTLAVKMLDKLPMADVRRLAKSQDVPRAVSIAARKKAVDA